MLAWQYLLQAIKTDVVRNLCARCELLCEDIEVVGELTGENYCHFSLVPVLNEDHLALLLHYLPGFSPPDTFM